MKVSWAREFRGAGKYPLDALLNSEVLKRSFPVVKGEIHRIVFEDSQAVITVMFAERCLNDFSTIGLKMPLELAQRAVDVGLFGEGSPVMMISSGITKRDGEAGIGFIPYEGEADSFGEVRPRSFLGEIAFETLQANSLSQEQIQVIKDLDRVSRFEGRSA